MVMHSRQRWLSGAALLALCALWSMVPAGDEPAALPSDLAKIPTDSTLIVSGRVADLWGKYVQPLRGKEAAEASRIFETTWGVLPEQIERCTLVILAPPPARDEPLFFLRTVKAYDRTKVLASGKKVKKET